MVQGSLVALLVPACVLTGCALVDAVVGDAPAEADAGLPGPGALYLETLRFAVACPGPIEIADVLPEHPGAELLLVQNCLTPPRLSVRAGAFAVEAALAEVDLPGPVDGLVLTDADGQGGPDLVLWDDASPTLLLVRWFAGTPALTTIDSGQAIVGVFAVAALPRDGLDDLVVSSVVTGKVGWLRQQPGSSGTYETPTPLDLAGQASAPLWPGACDVDRDGRFDVTLAFRAPGPASAGAALGVGVLFDGGALGYGSLVIDSTDLGGAAHALRHRCRDLDGDGTREWLWGLRGVAIRSRAQVTFATAAGEDYAVTDIDDDGVEDLMVLQAPAGAQITLLDAVRTDSGTRFTAAKTGVLDGLFTGVAGGDLDGDGHGEVVLASALADELTLLRWRGGP